MKMDHAGSSITLDPYLSDYMLSQPRDINLDTHHSENINYHLTRSLNPYSWMCFSQLCTKIPSQNFVSNYMTKHDG